MASASTCTTTACFVPLRGSRRLYAVGMAPAEGVAGRRGVVLVCPPLLEEQHWAYRALYNLALSLAAAGHRVWRFDHSGTGNSDGRLERLSDWVMESRLLADWIAGQEPPGSPLAVIGLRLGAFTAFEALAADERVRTLVLLEPVLDPERHLRQFLHRNVLRGEPGTAGPGGAIDCLGYELPRGFVDSFSECPMRAAPHAGLHILVLDLTKAGRAMDARLDGWLERQSGAARRVERRVAHGPPFWDRLGIHRPPALDQAVIDWIEEVS